MKKNLFVVLAIFLTFSNPQGVFAAEKITIKMSAKWVKLNTLVDKEINTIQTAGRLDAVLKYRLLELYAEKLALIKEKENKVFLQVSPEARKNKPQEFFFKESLTLYQKAHAFGQSIIKDHPRYKDLAHVYYTLGINSRDYAKDRLAEKYLLLAQGNLKQDTSSADVLRHKIKTSLSEYYYNEKNYPVAISYYNEVLKNKEDNWYTKHLYNAGWCNFKDKKYKTAIEFLKEAHFVGKKSLEAKDNKYISMSDQVMTSIGLFYVYNHTVAEGVEFYMKESPDAVGDLIKMAKIAAEQGDFPGLRNIVENAYKAAMNHSNHDEKVKVRLNELEFYRTFKKDDLYFQTALSLNDLNKEKALTPDDQEEAVNKIKEVVGMLQLKLNKDSKKDLALFKKEDLDRVISYFTILYEIDPTNEDSYRFYQGETYFSVTQYLNAAHAYEKAMLKSKTQEGRLEIKSKIMNALLGTISKDEFEKVANKEEVTRLTLFSYTSYLVYWPKDEKAQIIYGKLFNLYVEEKRLDDAIATIDFYNKSFPSDIKNQRDQLTRILDIYIKTKNSDQLSNWVNKLSAGYLTFDKDYIEKATEILGNILFEKFQVLEQKGQKEEAIKGHISLYEEQKYPKKVKGRAALNASILYLELGTVPESFEWQMKAFQNFPKEEIKAQLDKILVLSKEYALLQDFKHSGLLSEYALNNFCTDEFKQKNDFFKQVILSDLIQKKPGEHPEVFEKFEKFKKCNLTASLLETEKMKIVNESYKFFDYKSLEKSLDKLTEEKNKAEVREMIADLSWQELWKNKLADKNYGDALKRLKKYSQADANKIETYLQFEQKVVNFSRASFEEWSDEDKPFEAEKFNQDLEKQIARVKELTEVSKAQIQKSRPEIILSLYLGLAESYYHLAQILRTVTPNVPDKNFVASFKGQMNGLALNLEAEAKKYLNFGREKIQKDNFITEFNPYFYAPVYELNVFSKLTKIKDNKESSIVNNLITKDASSTQIDFLTPSNNRMPAEVKSGPIDDESPNALESENAKLKRTPVLFKERRI